MKKLVAALLICLISLLALSFAHAETTTVMVYMCGSDLESRYGLASSDLEEMLEAQMDAQDTHVIVMLSGTKSWDMGFDASKTSICEVSRRGIRVLEQHDAMSMGSSDTLKYFLDYAYARYDSDRYVLILWDHGAGPMMGVCFDELFPGEYGMDSLTLPELEAALSQSPFASRKLSWIGFDACLMASVEVAALVAPYADYMIASQETEPGSGWDYAFLRDISQDASPEVTGQRIIDDYFASIGETLASVTLSMTDLSVIPQVVSAMNDLFGDLGASISNASYTALTSCRMDTRSMAHTSPSEYDLVDLTNLLETYQAADVADSSTLMALLDQAMVASRANEDAHGGLSLYYPYYNKDEYLSLWSQQEITFSPGYQTFMNGVLPIWLGKSMVDWATNLFLEIAGEPDRTVISVQLTQPQAEHFGNAKLYILGQGFPGEYRLLYITNDVTLTEAGRLESVYEGKALYMVDENGQPLTEEVTYLVENDCLFIPVMLFSGSIGSGQDIQSAELVYRANDAGEFVLIDIALLSDDPLPPGKSAMRLDDWDDLMLFGPTLRPVYDETGMLERYGLWDKSDSAVIDWLPARGATWKPAFLDLYSSAERVAMLQVADNQNNWVYIDMISLDNPNITPVPVAEQVLCEGASARVTLTGLNLVSGISPGLTLQLRCENLTDAELQLTLRDFVVNSTLIDVYKTGERTAPGGTKTVEFDFDARLFQDVYLAGIERISFTLSGQTGYDVLFEESVSFDLTADLTAAFPVPEPAVLLASAPWKDLQMELLNPSIDGAGTLRGTLHIINRTGESVPINARNAYLDGVLHSFTLSGLGAFTLPAGTDTYKSFAIPLIDTTNSIWPYFVQNPLEFLGFREITELGIGFYRNSASDLERVTFTLPDALPCPAGAPAQWSPFYERDGVTISLMGSCTYPENAYNSANRFFYLLVRNETDHDISFSDSPYSNGPPISFSPGAVEARTMCCVAFSYNTGHEVAPDTFDAFETVMTVFDQAGRRDTVQLRAEPLAAPRAMVAEDWLGPVPYLHYDADSLRVTSVVESSPTSALLTAFPPADTWPVVYERDGVTVSVAGIVAFPDDPLRGGTRSVYLSVHNPTAAEVTVMTTWAYDNRQLVGLSIVPHGALPLMSVAAPGSDAMIEIIHTLSEGSSAAELQSFLAVFSITVGEEAADFPLVMLTPSGAPQRVERLSDALPVSCVIYGADVLNATVE